MTPFTIGVLAFGVVLAAAESLHRFAGVSSEDTRRLAHLGSALVAVALPFALGWWSIVALGALFTVLMAASRWRGALRGIHSVARSTWGEVLFPAGLTVLAAAHPSRALWVYGTLVMGLSDDAAGFIGQHAGRHRISIGAARKSVEGSVAFFLTTTMIGIVALAAAPGAGARPGLVAVSAAFVLTTIELVLPWGLDNLVLPTAAAASLWVLSPLPW